MTRTAWEVYYDSPRLREVWLFGGWAEVVITDHAMRLCRDVGALRTEAIAPFVWLSLPVHDDPAPVR